MKSINDFLHVVDDLDLRDLFSNIGAIFLAGKIQFFFFLIFGNSRTLSLEDQAHTHLCFIQADLVFSFSHRMFHFI